MPEYKLFLNVIFEMIEKIENSIKKQGKQEFMKSNELQDATLMRLQVIGENIKKIPLGLKKDNKQIKWKKFGKLRNLISHKYGSVDYEIIWNFINKNLTELKKEIQKILKDIKND